MSFKFNDVKTWKIPEGTVTQVKVQNGDLLWDKIWYRYVSLGDSIAAAQAIRNEPYDYYWVPSEYEKWQFPKVDSTVIQDLSYTDLLRDDMEGVYGPGFVYASSFAQSGDRVEGLMAKLDDERVKKDLRRANVVTVCIGANNVLQPAVGDLGEYVNSGSLEKAEQDIEDNFKILSGETEGVSYADLFDKIDALVKPGTRVVFTTVYNPFKYLHLDEGHDGFFENLLIFIPDWTINVKDILKAVFGDIANILPDYYFPLGDFVKDMILETAVFKLVFDRFNNLDEWVEKYVNRLNTLIRGEVNAYKATNADFLVAESKALFDTYPDRGAVGVTYDQLVNVEFNRGFKLSALNWGALWGDGDPYQWWWNLILSEIEFTWAGTMNPLDYVSLDMEGLASYVMEQALQKVILPDIDVHPEEGGHVVLKEAFSAALNNDYTKRGE